MSDAMKKLILDSRALSIWNHKTGPVFWYAAGVPGPFYLNTELMIGKDLAESLLKDITAIVTEITDPAARAGRLEPLILNAYRANGDFRAVVAALKEKTAAEFPAGSFSAISGGERRDWLFSIPLAAELNVKHVYLFKNKTHFCAAPLTQGEKTLHVSDLINNAASYIDNWLPMLAGAGLSCAGTVTVNTRGTAGIEKLEKAGCKVAALNRVDVGFFQDLQVKGMIDRATLDEITVYFTSARDWAERYLMGNEELFAIPADDTKSPDRMRQFFTQDPWGLAESHAPFFAAMRKKVGT